MMAIGEVDYLWKLGGGEEKKSGLPGDIKVGGWYDTGPRANLRDEAYNRGNNGGFYIGLNKWRFVRARPTARKGLRPGRSWRTRQNSRSTSCHSFSAPAWFIKDCFRRATTTGRRSASTTEN